MNNLSIVGRMTRDPELKYLEDGTAICNFAVAVNRPYKDKQTGKYEADFFDVSARAKTAEFVANHCGKGRIVSATGPFRSRKYQDNNGNNRTAWEMRADTVEGVGPATESNNNGGDAYQDD